MPYNYNGTHMIVSKIIKERGYTIEEVANKIGIARPTLAKTIGNNPTVNTLRKIARQSVVMSLTSSLMRWQHLTTLATSSPWSSSTIVSSRLSPPTSFRRLSTSSVNRKTSKPPGSEQKRRGLSGFSFLV